MMLTRNEAITRANHLADVLEERLGAFALTLSNMNTESRRVEDSLGLDLPAMIDVGAVVSCIKARSSALREAAAAASA